MTIPECIKVIRSHLGGPSGALVAVSADRKFLSLLKGVSRKYLELPPERRHDFKDTAEVARFLRRQNDGGSGEGVVLLMERVLFNKLTTETLAFIRETYPEAVLIVLTSEARKDDLVLLREIGAGNIIVKPVGAKSLIEKLANSIRPQGKLDQLMGQCRRLIENGEAESALELAENVLGMKPGSSAALMAKGDALLQLDRVAEAMTAYEHAHQNSKLFLEPVKRLVDLYEKLGDEEKQLKYMRYLDKLSPANAERKYRIGRIFAGQGRSGIAEQYFEMAQDSATREALDLVSHVALEIAEEVMETNPKAAQKHIERLLEVKGDYLSESDVKAFNTLGLSLRKQGRWRDALVHYRAALELSPGNEHLLYNAAMALAEGDEFEEALPYLEEAAHKCPAFLERSDNVAYNFGRIHHQAGRNSEACFYLEKALALNPRHQAARKLLDRLKSGA
ncbi:tetratricopeptide repeat protein [Desulfohalovibrio reitneri]|uniref:tetratricopeptide repeat protein n=1 Tax=Desulfohalovibrio reitneri TaxID=1307759 RepID=UPI0004A749F8|nr:tetratricopeptide repeat protein [Desulfohalovibrio reitneri]